MNKYHRTYAHVLVVLALLWAIFSASAETPTNTKLKYISSSRAYFLKSKGPQKQKLICFTANNKPKLGKNPKLRSGQVSYLPFNAVKAAEKKLSQAAIKECGIRLKAPACKDGCDNDSDGKIDFPEDRGCSTADDSEEKSDTEAISRFSVFRKPFNGEFPIASLFDHRYPLEFIHSDGEIISHDNEVTSIGVDGHQGYDYWMDEGTPLLASYDGTVVFAGAEDSFYCPPLEKNVSGNIVVIRHQVQEEQFDSIYAHLSSISVANGQTVSKGSLIGLSGNTGCSTGPHLHFDIQRRTNTNSGSPSSIDPSGWIGTAADPWELHASGTKSFRLWATGEAPLEFRLASLAPNPGPSDSAAIAIINIRWAGSKDDLNPNNEYVELKIDPRFYTAAFYNLDGLTLRNNKNEKFTFPAGSRIQSGQTLRVYSGSGVNSANELYWGRRSGAWDNNGDCVHLIQPNGFTTYILSYGTVSCARLTANSLASTTISHQITLEEAQARRLLNRY